MGRLYTRLLLLWTQVQGPIHDSCSIFSTIIHIFAMVYSNSHMQFLDVVVFKAEGFGISHDYRSFRPYQKPSSLGIPLSQGSRHQSSVDFAWKYAASHHCLSGACRTVQYFTFFGSSGWFNWSDGVKAAAVPKQCLASVMLASAWNMSPDSTQPCTEWGIRDREFCR